MSSDNEATKAAYYLFGLEVGLVTDSEVKEWAFSVIAATEQPPVEIIEIASCRNREQLQACLKPIIRNADDVRSAGHQLLALLRLQLKEVNSSHLHWVARNAMQIARSTRMPDEVCSSFYLIDEAIFLAVEEGYGELEACRADLERELHWHAVHRIE